MPQRILFAILALNCICLLAEEPELDDPLVVKPAPWILSQDKGLSKGSFNPIKRGLRLPPNAKIMVIPIHDDDTSKEGYMDEWQSLFVRRRLKAAEREKFDLVVLEIDTFGGLVVPTQRMIQEISTCKVPVIALVKNKAMSCGALLSLGCKMIVMEPNSQIGSAKILAGENRDFTTAMRQKTDAAMRAYVRNLCSQNVHPQALAEGMVDSNIEVIETTDSNQRFMTDEEFSMASKRGIALVKKWKLKDQILALTAKEAINAGLASGIAADMNEVVLGLNVPNATIVRMDISASEKVARFLSWQGWSWLLVIVALIGLFWEMASPGHGVGYAVFVFCMGVFFWLQIFSNNASIFEIVLFGLGALLVAVELFILPTFGALGFAGLAMVIFSIVLAFLPEGSLPGLLGYSGKPNEFLMHEIVQGMEWATLTLLSILGFFSLIWWKGISLPGVNRMALTTVNSGTVRGGGSSSATLRAVESSPREGTKLSAFAGLVGTTETVLRPAGKIRLDGATYDAVSEGGFIEAGAAVYVLRAQGSALVVRLSEKKE